jgi:hypothetical protein
MCTAIWPATARVGRVLTNAMLASGGSPWTVLPIEQRGTHMAALETANVSPSIVPFAGFLAGLVVPRP